MGPAAGFREHRDTAGRRELRRSARTEVTHQVWIAHRLPTECRCRDARALEGRSRSRSDVPGQRLRGGNGRYAICECVFLGESRTARPGAARGCSAVYRIDAGRGVQPGGAGADATEEPGVSECASGGCRQPDSGRASKGAAKRCGTPWRHGCQTVGAVWTERPSPSRDRLSSARAADSPVDVPVESLEGLTERASCTHPPAPHSRSRCSGKPRAQSPGPAAYPPPRAPAARTSAPRGGAWRPPALGPHLPFARTRGRRRALGPR